MRRLLALLLLAAALPAHAAIPSWLRIVDRDGQVTDLPGIALDSITLCPTRGDGNIFSQNDGEGRAIIETANGLIELTYDFKFYNQGAPTGNPNTTGDQVVLIEAADTVFGSRFEACVVHAP